MDQAKVRPKRLIVIAGPSCSGKSWLIHHLRSGTGPRFVSGIRKKCKMKPRILANRLRLASLEKSYAKGDVARRLKRGGYLHFDLTGRRQQLKRKILHELIQAADQVIVLNVVVGFDDWITANQERLVQDPEHSISPFVRALLKLHARDAMAARQCYAFMVDQWQQYLESYSLFRCLVVESRQARLMDQLDREQLGLVRMTPVQELWLRLRFMSLLAKVA